MLLSDSDRLVDGIHRERSEDAREAEQRDSDQHADGREVQTHFVYLLARAFLAPGMPVTFPLISALASQRDFGHIPRLEYLELQEGTACRLNGLICVLLRITYIR